MSFLRRVFSGDKVVINHGEIDCIVTCDRRSGGRAKI